MRENADLKNSEYEHFLHNIKHHFNTFYEKKVGNKPLIWLRFIDGIFFIWTDGEGSLKEFLAFYLKYSETKKIKSVIKFEISQSIKIISFLDACITLNQNLIYQRLFKTLRRSHLP